MLLLLRLEVGEEDEIITRYLGWAVAGPIGHFLISIPLDRSFLVGLLQRGRGGDKQKIG